MEAGIDRVLHELREKGVTADELERAKKAFIADFIYESDSQSALARRYAEGMLLGLTIEQINDWPEGHRQGDGRGRQARRRQAPRHPPLRHRQADPGGAGAGERRRPEAGANKS